MLMTQCDHFVVFSGTPASLKTKKVLKKSIFGDFGLFWPKTAENDDFSPKNRFFNRKSQKFTDL